MLDKEILKKIRHIEIRTRRLLRNNRIGTHRTAQKGYGLEFEQLADYQFGDDIRFIDWKSSARSGKLLVKEYREERSRTITLAVDYSASSEFATKSLSKRDLIEQISAILALIGNQTKDLVSLVIFSDELELIIPPGSGNHHVHLILKQLFSFRPKGTKTSINAVLQYLLRLKNKNSIIFLISDFIDSGFERALAILNKRQELVAIRCLDTYEYDFPGIGLLHVKDLETNQLLLINTSSDKMVNSVLQERLKKQTECLKKNGIEYIDIKPQDDFIPIIARFMQKRLHY